MGLFGYSGPKGSSFSSEESLKEEANRKKNLEEWGKKEAEARRRADPMDQTKGIEGVGTTNVGHAILTDESGVRKFAQNERDGAQQRGAAQLGTAATNKSIDQQRADVGIAQGDVNRLRTEGISGMQDSAGLARNLATKGDEGAAAMYAKGSGDAIRAARSLAASTAGGSGAQMAAARGGMSKAMDAQRGITLDAGLEQARARRQGMEMFGQQQGQIAGQMGQVSQFQGQMADRSMQRAGLENSMATTQLQSDIGQRQMNDAYTQAQQGLLASRDAQQFSGDVSQVSSQAARDSGGDAQAYGTAVGAVGGGLAAGGQIVQAVSNSDYKTKTLYSDATTKNFYGQGGTSDESFLNFLKNEEKISYSQAKENAAKDAEGEPAKKPVSWDDYKGAARAKNSKRGELVIQKPEPITVVEPKLDGAPQAGSGNWKHTPAAPPSMRLSEAGSRAPAPITPLAKSKKPAPGYKNDKEMLAAFRNTTLRPGVLDDEDTPEMQAARADINSKLDDPNHWLREDLKAFNRDTPEPESPAKAKPEDSNKLKVWSGNENTYQASSMGLDPHDPKTAKILAMPEGEAQDAAIRWAKVDAANREKALRGAEVSSGLRKAPEEESKGGWSGKGLFSGIGAALKAAGGGFSGRQVDTSDDNSSKYEAMNAKMQALQKETTDAQKKYQEAMRKFDTYSGPGATARQ